jgi:hypothetical protein
MNKEELETLRVHAYNALFPHPALAAPEATIYMLTTDLETAGLRENARNAEVKALKEELKDAEENIATLGQKMEEFSLVIRNHESELERDE